MAANTEFSDQEEYVQTTGEALIRTAIAAGVRRRLENKPSVQGRSVCPMR
jgi:hypothetical protein